MSFRTSRAVWTVAGLESFAYWAIGRKSDLVCLSEEGREAEVVGRRGVIEDGRGGRFDGGRHDELAQADAYCQR